MQSEKLLVDLNSVIEQLENEWGYESIREDLYKLPTVDAVEVVRCKGCIYAELSEDGDLYCDGPIGIFGTVGFNDFCSYGERRGGE